VVRTERFGAEEAYHDGVSVMIDDRVIDDRVIDDHVIDDHVIDDVIDNVIDADSFDHVPGDEPVFVD
jgi:hypothetical protein